MSNRHAGAPAWAQGVSGNTFAARLRELRHERDWSQARLADATAMSTNHIAYLELGHGEPSMETLRRLSAAFGMTMSELIAGVC